MRSRWGGCRGGFKARARWPHNAAAAKARWPHNIALANGMCPRNAAVAKAVWPRNWRERRRGGYIQGVILGLRLRVRACVSQRRLYAAALIAAARTSSLTAPSNVAKFASNRATNSRAVRSYAALSAQLRRGSSTSARNARHAPPESTGRRTGPGGSARAPSCRPGRRSAAPAYGRCSSAVPTP